MIINIIVNIKSQVKAMIKITNKKQLELFLKSISKNAVKNANNTLFENIDPYIDRFKNNLKGEMEDLQEQEEEEPEDEEVAEPEEEGGEEAEAEPEGEEEPEEGEAKAEPEGEDGEKRIPAAEKALGLIDYENDFDISFENVITALNTLRAGKSTKNRDIKTELNDYYDRLTEDERGVLLLYLNELSKVLTGAVDGDEAQDPSEPSTYFNIRKRDRSEPDPKNRADNSEKESDTDADDVSSDQQNTQAGLEDTTPPIKVNESQDLSFVYHKLKNINS